MDSELHAQSTTPFFTYSGVYYLCLISSAVFLLSFVICFNILRNMLTIPDDGSQYEMIAARDLAVLLDNPMVEAIRCTGFLMESCTLALSRMTEGTALVPTVQFTEENEEEEINVYDSHELVVAN